MNNRLRELRKARGWSLQTLADKVGTSAPQIQRLEVGNRQITLEWLDRLASALGCDASELLPAVPVVPTAGMVAMAVVGNLQSGKFFRDVVDAYDWLSPNEIVVPKKLAGKDRHAFLVADDSVAHFALRGSYIVAEKLPAKPKLNDGDWLVVERHNPAGVEITARQLTIAENGSYQLWPRSSNPRFQKPFLLVPPQGGYTLQEPTTIQPLSSLPPKVQEAVRNVAPSDYDQVRIIATVMDIIRRG